MCDVSARGQDDSNAAMRYISALGRHVETLRLPVGSWWAVLWRRLRLMHDGLMAGVLISWERCCFYGGLVEDGRRRLHAYRHC